MDWKSKRIRTILEAALAEDKVANDVTTALTIPPISAPPEPSSPSRPASSQD
ncbi:hypothetical protein [Tunturiibacter empetritectus]|uniref:hypothetical protein n=1 Tax=Tunturiibacter empetritectus TaxID=3069691 RepID=UPI003D9BB94D